MRTLVLFLFASSAAHADFKPKYSRYDASIGILRSGAVSQNANEIGTLRFAPAESGNSSWYDWFSNTANSSGPRGDHVHMAGWNCGSGAGLIITGDLMGGLCDSWEQFYITLAGDRVMERHLFFVPPSTASDPVTTRWISASGNLTTGAVGLYLFTTGDMTLGHGHSVGDFNAKNQIYLDATTSRIQAPSAYPRCLFDDGDGNLTCGNGSGGDNDKGHLLIGGDGSVRLMSKSLLRLQLNSATVLDADSSALTLYDPSGSNNSLGIDANGPYLYFGGVPALMVQAGATYTTRTFRPAADSSNHLGASGGRFLDAYLGGPANSQVGCDSDSRGAMMTVFDAAHDIFEVCMCSGATCAWRNVFTSP